jgi:hypothetical protein
MNSFIHFFDPFFSLWLYNHSNLSIVCLSIFFSMLMLSMNLLTMQLSLIKKYKTLDTQMLWSYFMIITSIVSGFILTFKELSLIKSLINILFPLLIFLYITRKIITFIFPFKTFSDNEEDINYSTLNFIYVIIMLWLAVFFFKLGNILKHVL